VGEVSAERRTMKLEGRAGDMIHAFEIKLDRYEHEGHQYRARTGDIKLPPELAPQWKRCGTGQQAAGGAALSGVSYTPPFSSAWFHRVPVPVRFIVAAK
jgi:hypothetical protein